MKPFGKLKAPTHSNKTAWGVCISFNYSSVDIFMDAITACFLQPVTTAIGDCFLYVVTLEKQ